MPARPVLLLLHGWTATADLTWRSCYPALEERFDLVAPEHPRHVDDVTAALTGPAIVAGFASGATLAQLLWRERPDLVAGLVLCAAQCRVRGIDVPTACVVTARDRVVPAARQLELAASVPHASVHEVDGDHGVCVADGDRFADALVAAVDSVAARTVPARRSPRSTMVTCTSRRRSTTPPVSC